MGWSSGSELAQEVWDAVYPHLPKKARQDVAQQIVEAFENHDADDWYATNENDEDLYWAAFKGKPRPGDDDFDESLADHDE